MQGYYYSPQNSLGNAPIAIKHNDNGITQANTQVSNPLRFPGQYQDDETGLHYNWNRYYDNSIGRYVISDPIGLLGGMNADGYVSGNPLYWIDPEGLSEINLGDGYTGRVDRFNYQGDASHEIHVFDKKGREVGVHDPKGWINKHGHKGAPEGLPKGVADQVKGQTIDELRKFDRFPPKGSVNIKGNK